jgi:tetratricopeptide (TPR) repeat protein
MSPPEVAQQPREPQPAEASSWAERLERLSPRGLAALLAAFALLAYAGAVPAQYAFDDGPAVLRNPVVTGQLPLWHAFTRDFWGLTAQGSVGTYRPFAVLALGLEWRLGGGASWVLHLGNVLWHGATIACFFLVFAPLVGRRRAAAAAALAAVLCAPAEAVHAVVGRADLLSAFFVLLALHFHRRAGVAAAAAAVACFGVALGSKESAIAALPAFWVMDRLFPTGGPSRLPRFAGYVLATGACLLGRAHALGSALGKLVTPQENPLLLASSPLERLLGASRVFLERYVAGLVDPGRRLYECSAWACGPAPAEDALAWAGLALALLVAVAPLLLWRRSPVAAAGLAWFTLFFLPVSNFLVLSPALYGERLLYLPVLGLELALVQGLSALAARLSRPAVAWGLLAALGLANLAGLQVRHLDWRSQASLYASALELAGDSAKVQQNVASAALAAQDWEAAEHHARRSLELWPKAPKVRSILAVALDQLGRTAEAEAEYRRGLADGRDAVLACDYATFLAKGGRLREAQALLQEQLRFTPADPCSRELLARVEEDLAGGAAAGPPTP